MLQAYHSEHILNYASFQNVFYFTQVKLQATKNDTEFQSDQNMFTILSLFTNERT